MNLRRKGKGVESGRRLTKDLICTQAVPMDRDNGVVKAWVGQEADEGQWEEKGGHR